MPWNVTRIRRFVVLAGFLTAFVASATLGSIPCHAQTRVEPVKATKSISDEKPVVDEAHPLYIPLQMAYNARVPRHRTLYASGPNLHDALVAAGRRTLGAGG